MSPTPRPSTLDRLIDVRSQLVRAVLAYLREEAKSACELPVYFPERLRAGPPFGRLRQRVRVTNRAALERWQARQQETDPYAANRPRSQNTLDWDDEVADLFTRAIVLGEPGAGKSWLLRYDAWRIATASAEGLADRRIGLDQVRVPVRIHLAELLQFLQRRLQRSGRISRAEAVRDALADAVVDRATVALESEIPATFGPWVLRTLETARSVVLLDALDEVPLDQADDPTSSGRLPGGRTGLGEYLAEWSRRFPNVAVRVTVRDAGYQRAQAPVRDAPELVLLALDDADVERFAASWFEDSPATSAADFAAVLKAHEPMRGLARNPLMLGLMCRVVEQRREDFPLRRVEFYDRCVRGLLREWKEEDKKQVIPVEIVEASIDVLSYVAVRLLPQNPPYEEAEVSRLAQEAASGLPAGALPLVGVVQRFKDDGLLVPVSARSGAPLLFLHRTVQEYVAGIGLVAPGLKAAGASPNSVASAAQIIAAALDTHVADAGWREAILLGLGYLGVTQSRVTGCREALVSAAIEATLDRASSPRAVTAELIGTAVAQMPAAATRHCLTRVQRELITAMRADGSVVTANVRIACGNTLARVGDPRFHAVDRWCLPNDVACGLARTADDDRLGFVEIRAGEALMGNDESGAPDNEQPQHRVPVEAFWIARWPVTVAQFRVFVNETVYSGADPEWAGWPTNFPVQCVTWWDAVAYCAWLSAEFRRHPERLPGVLHDAVDLGGRAALASEAEWEYAARGKTKRTYPWGNDRDPERANCGETGVAWTYAVGCFSGGVSANGVEELFGNAHEWTRSKYESYPYRSGDGREDQSGEARRVARGGNSVFWKHCRMTRRIDLPPGYRDGELGFRVVLTLG